MSFFEMFFLAAACTLYATTFFLAGKGLLKYSFFSLVSGLAGQFAAAAIRWADVGHPPVFGTYEATLSASWFLLLFAALSYRSVHRHFRLVVLAAVPLALLLLLYGIALFGTARIPLTISERSLWVDFHALFAWLAFAPFTLAFCMSGFYLWSSGSDRALLIRRGLNPATVRAERVGAQKSAHPSTIPIVQSAVEGSGRTVQGSPDMGNQFRQLAIIDELAFRYITFGFFNHSVMFALGSYYTSLLFGTWWRWDPVFSISLIAWILVGLYIHLRLFYKWKGRRAAWFFVAIFAAVNLSYWGLVYLPSGSTFHVFDIDPKML